MIAVIKYNGGNVLSVQHALSRIGVASVVTDDAETIRNAGKVIFPGVGNAAAAMQYLRQRQLDTLIPHLQQPVLGICLGMQLLCRHSEEGDTAGLGIFDAPVKLFPQHGYKVPHVGWNSIDIRDNALFEGVKPHEFMYYVHSYYVPVTTQAVATTGYIVPFAAAMQQDNFYAVQFHPERSGKAGAAILKNFSHIQ